MIEILKRCIIDYDRIIICKDIDITERQYNDILRGGKKVAFFMNKEVGDWISGKNIFTVSDGEMNHLMDLYRLYEFSDNVILLNHANYPGIDNLVKTGIITKSDMFEALGGKG